MEDYLMNRNFNMNTFKCRNILKYTFYKYGVISAFEVHV
jgi:hypothetical protein